MSYLLITVCWLDDRYHGKLNREGPAEWPPSPYRLFQALVAGVARQGELDGDLAQGLAWLQGLDPPMIVAPSSRPGTVITRYVPNNDGDKKTNRQDRLTGKLVCPTLMLGDPEVHYIWQMDNSDVVSAQLVNKAAQYLTCVGWGIDMAYASGRVIDEEEVDSLAGVRWKPQRGVRRNEGMLRTPIIRDSNNTRSCTLSDLRRTHQSALDRIEHGKPLNTVDKPKVFDSIFYESKERLLPRPYVTFELRKDNGEFVQYPQRKIMHIAGMVRHLAIRAMASKQILEKLLPNHDQKADPLCDGCPPPDIKDPDTWVDRYVTGNTRDYKGEHRQFSYLPLPSVGHTHADQVVRRVMIAAPIGDNQLLEHLAVRLAGQQLKPERENEFGEQGPPTLIRVHRDTKVVPYYTQPAATWASVTPVILPGHNDHKPAKTIKLIEKALRQSGIEQPCTFEWRAVSWWSKSLSAHHRDREGKEVGYLRPKHLRRLTAVHLKLMFEDDVNVPGPLVIGAGRHCGLGLMARLVE